MAGACREVALLRAINDRNFSPVAPQPEGRSESGRAPTANDNVFHIGTVREDWHFAYCKEATVVEEKKEHDREGETNKPPAEGRQTQGPVDGPGKSGAGEEDLGDTSQGEPGN
jgi:hypothetical protein